MKYLIILWVSLLTQTTFAQLSRIEQHTGSSSADNTLKLPGLVDRFYQMNNSQQYWFIPGKEGAARRIALKNALDNALYSGLNKNNYNYTRLLFDSEPSGQDTAEVMAAERVFTDAALLLAKDLYQGDDVGKMLSYDELSKKYAEKDNDYLLNGLHAATTGEQLARFFASLEPTSAEYTVLKNRLKTEAETGSGTSRQLITAMNHLRWINHFGFEKYVMINLASATGKYVENNNTVLEMKTIVGKPSTKTPRFAAHCDKVILYPYWHVPQSIAVNEILPKVKRDPSVLEAMNMDVIDRRGKVVNAGSVNWSQYSAKNFPYQFRQSTGCDNALGVIKFNLTAPFSVYMHDTNSKSLFRKENRYFSHGCIRLEDPVKLANYLTGNKVDNAHLKACYKNRQPETINLPQPVPVFVVYLPADVDNSSDIKFYKDIYGLVK